MCYPGSCKKSRYFKACGLISDWCLRKYQVCGYISTGLSTVAVKNGNGKHFSLLTTEQQENTVLYTTAAFCPGVISFGLPKMAVVILLTRLLNPSRYHKWFIWWLGIWCQLTLFATCGLLLGQCTPTNSLWNFSVEGKCFDKSILVGYCVYAGCGLAIPPPVYMITIGPQANPNVKKLSRHSSTFTWPSTRL